MITPKNLLFSCLFIALFMHGSLLNGQQIKARIFINSSYTALADLSLGPLKEVRFTKKNTSLDFNGYSREISIGIISYQYGIRLNLKEKGPDYSVGIWVPFTASISSGFINYSAQATSFDAASGTTNTYSIDNDCSGYGRLSFPIFLQFGFGAGSTYKTDKEKGTTAGIGVEMNLTPLIIGKTSGGEVVNVPIKRFNIMPAINIGHRSLRKNALMEYNLKFGYALGPKEYERISTPGMVIMFTVGKILNY
ncbi:MAG: hypothetical protein CFE21_10305 [Bacteroidetes bacterium B1(2017)]|nr:MAG: hypothetical protein CFE21_10305 [Bacteroidetes bacterium B1(2017)]